MSARDETVLAAGGLLPLDASIPEGEPVDRVEARAYSHPALPGRAVVRLTAENLAAAADLELDVLGFTAAEVRGPVGFERRRALRFPGSAILSDPKNARYALDVVKDLRKAARKAKSKPGHAKELVDAIGSPARSRTSCHRSMKRWGASSSTSTGTSTPRSTSRRRARPSGCTRWRSTRTCGATPSWSSPSPARSRSNR